MRTLLYVPVIHTSADLGSLAGDIAKRGVADLGEDIWKAHTATIERFWDSITDYFTFVDVSGMKIYQDGMVADGAMGQRIIEEGAKQGSRNHELVASLLERGAVLIKTEDFSFVCEERNRLLAIMQAKSITRKLIAFVKYKFIKNKLLGKRDEFIAKRINETLGEKGKGILFIGAGHNIKNRLPESIQIKEIKDIDKVREYQRLLPFYRKNRERFDELGKYLIAKIEV